MALPAYVESMPMSATYWAPGINDGVGGLTAYGQPTVIACRWQDVAEVARTSSGEEFTSSAVVYSDRALAVRGMLALGDHTVGADAGYMDPNAVAGAREIRAMRASPSLGGDEQLNKNWL